MSLREIFSWCRKRLPLCRCRRRGWRRNRRGRLFLRVGEKFIGPRSLRGGRTADAEAWADALHGFGGFVVKMEIGFVFRIADPEIDVRLVPDFEIPFRNFLDAVAVDEMFGECFDHRAPLVPILRRRDILLVPEGVEGIGIGGQLFGHEAELDERADFVGEDAVVDLIDVGKIVDGVAAGVFVVEADFVLEDSVETDVVEIGDAFDFAEIVAIVVAQREDGASGAEHFFPEVGEGVRGGVGVDFDGFGDGVLCVGCEGVCCDESETSGGEEGKSATNDGVRVEHNLSPGKVIAEKMGRDWMKFRRWFGELQGLKPRLLAEVYVAVETATHKAAGVRELRGLKPRSLAEVYVAVETATHKAAAPVMNSCGRPVLLDARGALMMPGKGIDSTAIEKIKNKKESRAAFRNR